MKRTPEQWAGMCPRTVAETASPAAVMYALRDAQADIAELCRRLSEERELRAAEEEGADELFDVVCSAVESLDGLMNVCEETFAGENLSALQKGGNDFWTPARAAFIRLLAAVDRSWIVLPEDSHV